MINKKRFDFCGVPVDVLNENDIEEFIFELSNNGKHNQIIFLSFDEFMKARKNSETLKILNNAALVLPVSKVFITGFRKCKLPSVKTYMPFYFILKILSTLEKRNNSIYLMGPKINTVTQNVRASYPNLSIVGRCKSNFDKTEEQDILTALKKASPTITLIGPGIKKGNSWIYNNLENLNPGIFIHNIKSINVMAGKEQSPSEKKWENKKELFPSALYKPWKIFRYLHYLVILKKYRKELNGQSFKNK